MNRLVRFIGSVLALALLGLAVWAVYRGIDEEPAIVGSIATAAAAIIAVVVGRERELRAELQFRHREAMLPVYMEMIDRGVNAVDRREGVDEFYKDLQIKLLSRGPLSVIKANVAWTTTTVEQIGDDFLAWERVLLAIRKDLGFDDSDFKQGDLLKAYIKPGQIDEMLAARREGREPDFESVPDPFGDLDDIAGSGPDTATSPPSVG